MTDTARTLSDESLIIVLAYAPAGLGHLRVTDALHHGLPEGTPTVLLGSQDKTITFFHHLTSIRPFYRRIFEWSQYGTQEAILTRIYRFALRARTDLLYSQLVTVMDQRLKVPQTILVVATHYGLAHQLAVIKERLSKEKNIRVVLVVQVTDDSPQDIWYVPGADLIFVPSQQTKRSLQRYAKREQLPPVDLVVNPYPVSTLLSHSLTQERIHARRTQLDPDETSHIHLAIPVSGAAVGMEYFEILVNELHRKSDRFRFHIISKITSNTQGFLNTMIERPEVTLSLSTHDRETVNKYEVVYTKHVISLEVTKPSEQAFKSLLTPHQVGGSILLFAKPVGRQEYDNIHFMIRHGLIPTYQMQKVLWKYAADTVTLDDLTIKSLRTAALSWRGIQIPPEPQEASIFIMWLLREGIFSSMMHAHTHHDSGDTEEISSHGVRLFWDKVAGYLLS